MKLSTFNIKLQTAIGYPFVLVYAFIVVFTFYPLCMLLTFADGREEGTDYYLFKNEFIERYGTPKKFFVTVWNITEQMTNEAHDYK